MFKNIGLLSALQALMMSGNTLLISTSALVGFELASDKSLATLPLALQFFATMLMTIPAALLMNKIGRRSGFAVGGVLALLGAALLAYAVIEHHFIWFSVGAMFIGAFNGFGVYYRFAAVEVASEEYKSRAISWVLAGGVIAAIIGPNLANWTHEWSSIPFAGSFLALCGVYVLSLLSLLFLRVPDSTATQSSGQPRPLSTIMSQPVFIVALVGAMLGYGVMSLVMTATPLAMKHHAHPFTDTAFVIQWHVLGMYAPSFFTGHLIRRWGVNTVMLIGALLYVGTVSINMMGSTVWHYWFALLMLGVGWNFLFVGGTTLLTESYDTHEKAKVQALNDFLIFSTVTLASVSAGALQYRYGWEMVNLGVVPLIVIILASIVWLMSKRRRLQTETS
jgi:MFS family permease